MATSQSSTAINNRQIINRRKRRPPRRDKNSLWDILKQHAGKSLFVLPICWIDLYSQLLGVKWEELPPCDTPQPPNSPGTPSRGHLEPSGTIIKLTAALDWILEPNTDLRHWNTTPSAIETVLQALWPTPFSIPHESPELHLCFGRRLYRDVVDALSVWSLPSNEADNSCSSPRSVSTVPSAPFNVPTQSSPSQRHSNPSIICYIGQPQLALARDNRFGVTKGSEPSSNDPVFRLRHLKRRTLDPSNPDQDAYFIGLFLEMAQKHFYPTPSVSGRCDSQIPKQQSILPRPNFHDLKLRILTHDVDEKEFIVYTGYLTRGFLQKFHNPSKAPANDDDAVVSGLKIEYTRVPIWPILGLRERLGKALGPDIVGNFNPDEMETWETDPETDPRKQNGKRRRPSISPQAVQKETAKRNKR